MKQQVFFIHGASSYSNYEDFLKFLKTAEIRDLPGAESVQKWTDTLREELGARFEVFMPTMPNKQNARYLEWKIWFERHFDYLHDGVILIGWSQGGYFLAKYLVENDLPFAVKALFLIASPIEPVEFCGEDGGDFEFNISRVGELANKANKIYILCSKDDFVVPYEHSLKYKESLPEAKLLVFEEKNHFLVEEFTELLDVIREI